MSMRTVRWPWEHVKKGQGFFVPCLDMERTREDGLGAAVKARVLDAKCIETVHDGAIGLLFYRAPSSAWRAAARPGARRQAPPASPPPPSPGSPE